MKEDNLIKLLVGAVIMMVGIVIFLIFNKVIPVNPVTGYFLNRTDNMEYFNWEIKYFQPVYLSSTSKDNKHYFKVAYRDMKNNIKVMDLLVGQSGTESGSFVRVATSEGLADIEKLSDYSKYVSFGKRIRVSYIRNVLKRSDGSTPEIIEPTDLNVSVICNINPQNCLPIKVARENPEPLWNFSITEKFPKETDFPVMLIYTELLN